MILADTSVWVDHLRTGDPVLVDLLESDRVGIHPFIIGEIALGHLKARAQIINSSLTMDNLVVEYEDLQLAFAGRGAPVGAVTVRLVGLQFEFFFLDALLGGAGPIPMPDFRSTLTTEDMSSTG